MKYLIAYLFLALSLVSVDAQSLDIPLITVEGVSTVFVQPDEIVLEFSISKRADVLAEARSKNEETAQAAISFLRSKGIPSKHIQTKYMNIGPKLNKANKVSYFEATQTIHICLSDVKQYDDIVDGLIGLEIYRIGNPIFKTTKMEEAKEQAKRQSIQDAKAKATLLASELGQTIGKAKLIEEINVYQGRNTGAYSSGSDFGGGSGDDDLSFAPGQVQIQARIKVSFQLN